MLSEKTHPEMRKSVVLISMLLFASLSAVSVVGELSWSVSQVAGSENSYNSIAIDGNKNVHVAYYAENTHTLEYGYYDGSSWTYTTVDAGGAAQFNVGKYNSIAIDSNDRPHISYYDETNGNLKYAFYNGSSWTLDTIDESTHDVGMYSSIALDSSDGVYVSYYNATGENPALLLPPGSMILGWEWPTSANTGLYTSIAIDSQDALHLTYYDETNGDLEYKYSDDPFSTTSWSTNTIDNYGDTGMYSSIAVDSDDTPHVSYYDGTNLKLKYSYDQLGAGGGSWSAPIVVETVGEAQGMDTSIAIDPENEDNEVHISYYDVTNGGDLKYATGINGNFTISIVDGGGTNVGLHSSIAIDSNGKLHIIFVAKTQTGGDILKYASAEPEIGGGITGHLEWDEQNTVMTGQASLSDLDPGEEYSVAWELINDDTGGVISTFPNTSVTAPTSGVWSSSSHSWDLNTLNRGIKYCVEAYLYADEPGESGALLDSHTICTTIPNLSNEEVFSELEWLESSSVLSGYVRVDNLTENSDYNVTWRLVYNSNYSGININPNSTITGDASGTYISATSTWSLGMSTITRGLTYCVDSDLYADTGEFLDNSYSCKQIPNSGGGTDDDSDGVLNTIDICPDTPPLETVDSNGCSQSQLDDDGDGVANSLDACPNGQSGWNSSSSTDHDGDGCKDDGEDDDDDNDSIDDDDDGCPTGDSNWDSWQVPVIDHDHDGCKDASEDDDDDDDGVDDTEDSCTYSNIGAEVDASGCQTNFFDFDMDGVANSYDDCPDTDAGTAVDFWGCEEGRNSETEDEDNDGVYNAHDNCWDGETGWTSEELTTDYDTDGCRDSTEDWDDDDDGIDDSADSCYNGQRNWYSWDNDPVIDYDHDGCLDSNEDSDDDNDGVPDENGDSCLLTRLGAVVDANGCETSFPDDDNDGVSNSYDQCPNTPQNTPAEEIDDWNGCAYNDQSGGIFGQLFPQGAINYVSSSCNGPDDLSAQCMQAWESWCSENSFNHHACQVIVNECEDEEGLLGAGISRDFEIEEHQDDISVATSDNLMKVQAESQNEELYWANVRFTLYDRAGNQYACYADPGSGDCDVIQFGAVPETWESPEMIVLAENGNDICDDGEDCELTLLIQDVTLDNETIGWAGYHGDAESPTTIDDLPDDWIPEICEYLDIVEDDGEDETEGSGDTEDNETDDSTGDEWWAEIPVAGEIIAQIQSKYGKIIGATVFTLGVIGYGYRAITFRSEMVMNKRVKKFKKKIKRASRASTLRQIQTDVEKAEEKRLLPTGAYGDLLSMIEMRAEDIGLTDFIPKETLVAAGISDDEFRDGMDALNEARDELFMATDELRRQGQRAQRVPVERGGRKKDLVSLKAQSKSSISRPSYHPKDINKDGNVDEEDERMWASMSDEERQARSSGPFGGDTNLTSQILAFSKVPASSKSPCHCGSRKQYRKCHMRKDRCPCGSKKKFLSCCAKKRGFK